MTNAVFMACLCKSCRSEAKSFYPQAASIILCCNHCKMAAARCSLALIACHMLALKSSQLFYLLYGYSWETLGQMWAHVYVHSVESNYIHSASIEIDDEFLSVVRSSVSWLQPMSLWGIDCEKSSPYMY